MLRKKLLAIAFVGSLFGAANTQAQVYEKGNMILDAYYGGPNLYTAVVKTAFSEVNGYHNPKVTSIGPLGGKFEYLLGERIGIGLNVNYANSSVKATTGGGGTDFWGDPDTSAAYSYKASIPRLRVMPTFNIHMGSNDNFDPYFSFGVGYSSFKIKESSSDPTYGENITLKSPTNIAMRAEFGMRYFFTDNIGAHVQFGIGGGPLVAGGLSVKF